MDQACAILNCEFIEFVRDSQQTPRDVLMVDECARLTAEFPSFVFNSRLGLLEIAGRGLITRLNGEFFEDCNFTVDRLKEVVFWSAK